MRFEPGTLWRGIVRTTGQALRSGSLLPIPTEYTFIEDGGVRFFVRVLAGLRRKDDARRMQEAGSREGRSINPFLPPEKDLTVADISDTHVAVLNKFNVVDHHLLIVTKSFVDQDMLLTLPDFEALWLCMTEYESLGFYNGGRDAGASQQHRHLQVVPLPLAPEGPSIPIEPLLAAMPKGGVGTLPGFSFLHAFVRLDAGLTTSPERAAETTYEIYQSLLTRVGMQPPSTGALARQSLPYCLIVTREWMLLVPRSREHFEDISFNSLAFAGSLFVRDQKQIDRLKSYGPMKALRHVAVSR